MEKESWRQKGKIKTNLQRLKQSSTRLGTKIRPFSKILKRRKLRQENKNQHERGTNQSSGINERSKNSLLRTQQELTCEDKKETTAYYHYYYLDDGQHYYRYDFPCCQDHQHTTRTLKQDHYLLLLSYRDEGQHYYRYNFPYCQDHQRHHKNHYRIKKMSLTTRKEGRKEGR